MSQRAATAVETLIAVNRQIKETESALERLKGQKNELEVDTLPAIFAEEGIRSLELPTGGKAKLGTKAAGSLPKEPDKRWAAIEWLSGAGYADLIEAKVTASWNKAEREKAIEAFNQLRGDNSAKVVLDEGVNHMTLGRICKERVVSGLETPLELLGVTVLPRVTITNSGATNDE